MSSQERRRAERAPLRANITELEKVGNQTANSLLLDTTIRVDMINIEGGFTLPEVAVNAFRQLRARQPKLKEPQMITGMNLDLSYDQVEHIFNIRGGAVAFDNGYGLSFAQPRTVPYEDEPHHPLTFFRKGPRGKLTSQQVGLKPVSVVEDFFRQCGMTIPLAPQSTNLDAVMPLLSAAETRAVTASTTQLIDVSHELIIAKQTLEKEQPATARGKNRKPAWMEEVSLQLVDYGGLSVRALEAVLRSDSPKRPPKFSRLFENSGPRELVPPNYAASIGIPAATPEPIESVPLQYSPLLASDVQKLTAALQAAGEPPIEAWKID